MLDQPLPRRYIWGTLAWTLAFMILLIMLPRFTDPLAPGSAARIALSLLPLLVVPFAFRLDFDLFRKLDEMQRQMMLESLAIGAYITVLVCAAGVMLEEFGGLPRMSAMVVLVCSGAGSVMGWLIARRRYQ